MGRTKHARRKKLLGNSCTGWWKCCVAAFSLCMAATAGYFGAFLLIVALLFCAASAQATVFTFTKVVDTATAIPDGTGSFTSFEAPSIDNSEVSFVGNGASGFSGVYKATVGAVTKIADENTAIPGGGGNFSGFQAPSIHAGTVAFLDFNDSGVFTGSGGALNIVADENTIIPDDVLNRTFENFIGHLQPALSYHSGITAFAGDSTGSSSTEARGHYAGSSPGSLGVIVDRNTFVPDGGGDTFDEVASIRTHNGTYGLIGGDFIFGGIYSNGSGLLAKVADENTAIPDGSGNFSSITTLDYNNGSVAFLGSGPSSQQGIYTDATGTLTTVADKTIAMPGTADTFGSLGVPSIASGQVVFFARGMSDPTNHRGIYTNLSGTLEKVLAKNDPFDSKTVSSVTTSNEGFSDQGEIALSVVFTNGSRGIYIATPGAGSTQVNPMLPSNGSPPWSFTGTTGDGAWFDPPLTSGYTYTTDGSSLFTKVGLPIGLLGQDGLYTVSDGVNPDHVVDISFDPFYTFPSAVSSFTIMGIDPQVDSGDPLAFPTFLEFNQSTVTFTLEAIPEPSSSILAALGLLSLGLYAWRRP